MGWPARPSATQHLCRRKKILKRETHEGKGRDSGSKSGASVVSMRARESNHLQNSLSCGTNVVDVSFELKMDENQRRSQRQRLGQLIVSTKTSKHLHQFRQQQRSCCCYRPTFKVHFRQKRISFGFWSQRSRDESAAGEGLNEKLPDVMWRRGEFGWSRTGGFILGFLPPPPFTPGTSTCVPNAAEEAELAWWLHPGAERQIPLSCPPTAAPLT